MFCVWFGGQAFCSEDDIWCLKLDRSQPLFDFVPREKHSQTGPISFKPLLRRPAYHAMLEEKIWNILQSFLISPLLNQTKIGKEINRDQNMYCKSLQIKQLKSQMRCRLILKISSTNEPGSLNTLTIKRAFQIIAFNWNWISGAWPDNIVLRKWKWSRMAGFWLQDFSVP